MNRDDRDERSLLLYFETQAVDYWGIIKDTRCMNAADLEIMKRWNEEGFVLSKRTHRDILDGSEESPKIQLTYAVKLSEEAWKIAHELRKERALRHIPEVFEVKT